MGGGTGKCFDVDAKSLALSYLLLVLVGAEEIVVRVIEPGQRRLRLAQERIQLQTDAGRISSSGTCRQKPFTRWAMRSARNARVNASPPRCVPLLSPDAAGSRHLGGGQVAHPLQILAERSTIFVVFILINVLTHSSRCILARTAFPPRYLACWKGPSLWLLRPSSFVRRLDGVCTSIT